MNRWIAATAIAAAALAPYAPAHAGIGDTTACVIVWQDGTLPPPFTTGPVCAPFYTGPVNCQTIDVPLTNFVKLHVMICFPR